MLAAFARERTALLRNALRAGTLASRSPPVVLALGNEACDLDSTVSALAYAYVWDRTPDGRPLVPVLGAVSRAAVEMRGDVVHVLGMLGLGPSDLCCLSDLKQQTPAGQDARIDVVMLDHNEPSIHWPRVIGGTSLGVLAIVDHHEDAGLFPDASPRIVRPCGSTCSLLTCLAASSPALARRVVPLLRSALFRAIVTDTVGMTWRQTPTDAHALRVLASPLAAAAVSEDAVPDTYLGGAKGTPTAAFEDDEGVSMAEPLCLAVRTAWEEMERAQDTIPEESVPLRALMHKDYKQYVDPRRGHYGITVLHVPFQTYLARPGGIAAFLDDARAFMAELGGLALLVFVNSIRPPEGGPHVQQLGVVLACADAALLGRLEGHFNGPAAMGLARIAGDGASVALYDQENRAMTRKRVHPELRRFLASL